jgi:hypothetical protein
MTWIEVHVLLTSSVRFSGQGINLNLFIVTNLTQFLKNTAPAPPSMMNRLTFLQTHHHFTYY